MTGKISLVTGASRGIGAATALKLAESGSDIALNYRSKAPRAELVAAKIRELKRRVLLVQADLTSEVEVAGMMQAVGTAFGKLDVLVLNASGGLEKGKADGYAMELNVTAQMRTVRLALPLLTDGGRVVFVTSHWAHFHGVKPVMPAYEQVAKSKRAGEDALRGYATELSRRGISLVVVSGDAIDGTITLRLLDRTSPGIFSSSPEPRVLPTVEEFAAAVSDAAMDATLVNGQTIFVGSTEW